MNNPTLILPETCEVIEQGIQNNLHTGMQLYVSVAGKIIADFGYGEARPKIPMNSDSITLWLSSGKPISAVAYAILKDHDEVDWDSPIIKFIPEFRGGGKEKITVKHILTHTSGLSPVITGWPHADWDEIIQNLLQMKLRSGSVPGEKAEYQPACTWFLLGEIITRVSGLSFQDFIRKEILEPLGMNNSWCGMTPADYQENQEKIAFMYARRKKDLLPLEIHSETHCCSSSPGGNFRGKASDLGRFYEMMLKQVEGMNGQEILKPETVQQMITPQRSEMYDHTFQSIINMGMGFILDSRTDKKDQIPYGYGQYSSKKCFGHGGAQSSIGFCDPDHNLVIIAVSNGMAGEPRHNMRSRLINEAIYRDLGLQD